MNQDEIKLPRSSFDEVKKILKGYAHLGENVSLDTIAKLLGMNRSVVSGNNPFLTAIGLLEGSRVKNLTPLGAKLSRAIQHNQEEDTQKYLQEVVQNSEFLSNLISTVRIKGGMADDDLVKHILYVADLNPTKGNKTGARTIVDLLKASGLVDERDGKIVVHPDVISGERRKDDVSLDDTLVSRENVEEKDVATPKDAENLNEDNSVSKRRTVVTTSLPTITINIQLQIPATENATVYENLFKALREQLIEAAVRDGNEF